MDKAGLREVFRAALSALDPEGLVDAALRADRPDPGRHPVTVLGLGKAAAAMARGLARHYPDVTGVVVTPEPAELPDGLRNLVGSHPVPDLSSAAAGEALLDAAQQAPVGSLAVCLLSGGGSALAESPRNGIAMSDISSVTESLMLAGADIEDLNAVRVALSNLKGGGLAAATQANLVTLAISDVAPLGAHVIASGPTAGRGEADPGEVLRRHGLWDAISPTMRAAVDGWEPHRIDGGELRVVADGAMAATAAAAAVEGAGLRPVLAAHNLAGEARDEAVRVIDRATPPGAVSIYWGETTVTVIGSGTGGRNHEAALAAAIALDGDAGAFLAAGTDGVDGTTTGAGAVVDGATAASARQSGLDPAAYLEANDSGAFFGLVPGRIETGPTGTNVADLWLYSVD